MMHNTTRIFRHLALWSYLGLFAWVICWYLLLDAGQGYSTTFIVLFWFVPLVLPAKGIIAGNPYTHAWANFIVMIYLMHGFTDIYANSEQWLYPLIEIILATCMLIGCCFFARMRGKELNLGLKKLSELDKR